MASLAFSLICGMVSPATPACGDKPQPSQQPRDSIKISIVGQVAQTAESKNSSTASYEVKAGKIGFDLDFSGKPNGSDRLDGWYRVEGRLVWKCIGGTIGLVLEVADITELQPQRLLQAHVVVDGYFRSGGGSGQGSNPYPTVIANGMEFELDVDSLKGKNCPEKEMSLCQVRGVLELIEEEVLESGGASNPAPTVKIRRVITVEEITPLK